MSAPDVSDLKKAGNLPADAAAGAVPMPATETARGMAAKMATEQLDKSALGLPSHIPSECELLAAILWSGSFAAGRLTIESVSDLLDGPEPFHLPSHRAVWAALLALATAKIPPTPVAVHSEMVAQRSERNGGGIAYLDALTREAKPASEVTARGYAQTIRDAWVRRKMIAAAQGVESLARNGSAPIDDVSSGAVATITSVANSAVAANKSFVRLSKALADMSREMDAPVGDMVKTGFRDVDEQIGGLVMKETSLIGARTSIGKTCIAMQWSENIVRESGNTKAVFYISLEMRATLFAGRLAASRAGVEARKIRRRELSDDDKFSIRKASFELGKLHVYFIDNLVQTLESIHSGAKALRKKLAAEGVTLALIVIDHVGLVKPSAAMGRREKREQVGETSRGLRWLATEHDCHVIGIGQINREAAKRTGEDAIPKLHEFRDCGGLEDDADNAFILHRERSKKGGFVRGAGADLIIAKQRSGETAELKLSFEEQFVRFGDWNGQPDDER